MTIKKTIESAIEGGYRKGDKRFIKIFMNDWKMPYLVYMDKKFWQALGKAMGWNNGYCTGCDEYITSIMQGCGCGDGEMVRIENFQDEWKYKWHKFIDHLSENKSIEDFFKDL